MVNNKTTTLYGVSWTFAAFVMADGIITYDLVKIVAGGFLGTWLSITGIGIVLLSELRDNGDATK